MFDLILGLQQVVEGRVKYEVEIMGSQPLLGIWDYVTGMRMSTHGFTHA